MYRTCILNSKATTPQRLTQLKTHNSQWHNRMMKEIEINSLNHRIYAVQYKISNSTDRISIKQTRIFEDTLALTVTSPIRHIIFAGLFLCDVVLHRISHWRWVQWIFVFVKIGLCYTLICMQEGRYRQLQNANFLCE